MVLPAGRPQELRDRPAPRSGVPVWRGHVAGGHRFAAQAGPASGYPCPSRLVGPVRDREDAPSAPHRVSHQAQRLLLLPLLRGCERPRREGRLQTGEELLYLIDEGENLGKVTKAVLEARWGESIRSILDLKHVGVVMTIGAERQDGIPKIILQPDIVRRFQRDNYIQMEAYKPP